MSLSSGPLEPREVVPDRVSSIGQIKLFDYLNVFKQMTDVTIELLVSTGGNIPEGTNYTATQDTAGEAEMSSSVMYSYGPPHMAEQKQDDQLEHTYSSYVRIRDVALKTCRRR